MEDFELKGPRKRAPTMTIASGRGGFRGAACAMDRKLHTGINSDYAGVGWERSVVKKEITGRHERRSQRVRYIYLKSDVVGQNTYQIYRLV